MEEINKQENKEQATDPKKLITDSLENNKAVMDDPQKWEKITEHVIENYDRIITFRGAGSNNGIDPEALNTLLQEKIIPEVQAELENGKSVALMYDGDGDSLEKPDIGAVMGRLKDAFKDQDVENVLFLTAQREGWYGEEGANIVNANGEQYMTYVFEKGKYEGDHNSFTQSKAFANAEGYEQWYVGASGSIATEQLQDFNNKVFDGSKQKVKVFQAPINENLTTEIQAKLEKAKADQDEKKIAKFKKVIAQRENKYGTHWDNEGNSTINTGELKNLEFEFVK